MKISHALAFVVTTAIASTSFAATTVKPTIPAKAASPVAKTMVANKTVKKAPVNTVKKVPAKAHAKAPVKPVAKHA